MKLKGYELRLQRIAIAPTFLTFFMFDSVTFAVISMYF